MKFENIVNNFNLIHMQNEGDRVRFIDRETPHLKMVVQFPVTKYTPPVDDWYVFEFTQPSFHIHLKAFQEQIRQHVPEYDPEDVLKLRSDPPCAYFHHKSVDTHWNPDHCYMIPMVAIHGLCSIEGKMQLDLQIVQIKFYEKEPILPNLIEPLFN